MGTFALFSVLVGDPAPGVLRSKEYHRRLECERLSAEAASRERPGQIPPARPRGEYQDRTALICKQRVLRDGLRTPRDEAVLASLDTTMADFARTAVSNRPDLAGRTWMVEVFHPSAQVSAKVAFAGKNALMQQGVAATDRVPLLGAGDLDVLTRLPPEQAYPGACLRYWTTGGLRADDALLAIVSLDPRETSLHLGVCTDGTWTWLR
jgi:hypothetical protein